jgi:hypothetical protein
MDQWIADQQAQALSHDMNGFNNGQASNLRDSKNRIRLSSNSNTKHSSTQGPQQPHNNLLVNNQYSHSPATQTNYSSSKQYITS